MNPNNLIAGRLNLISRDMISCPERFLVEIGNLKPAAWATVTQISTNKVYVMFDAPQLSTKRGQLLSIFDGLDMVGTCVID